MKRDEELNIILRIKDGDTALYNRLVVEHSPKILALVREVVGNQEDAEEISQDVFVKAFFSLKSFRGECSFSTWLYRIAYNMSITAARKKKRVSVQIDSVANISDNSEEQRIETKEMENKFNILYKAVDNLHPEERFIILSFYNYQKSIKEISEITGISESNVKVKLHRIKKRLGVLIGDKIDLCYG